MQVVIGSGPVGTAIATLLAEQGQAVRLITRSGRGPENALIERRALDASDAPALAAATTDATVIYNAANPTSYASWTTVWPPLAASILDAARSARATLAMVGNLYAYGPVDRPMTEDLPLAATEKKGMLRARMWQDALAAHERGEVRALEVRASDYIGVGGTSYVGRTADLLARGKRVSLLGAIDQPHTWTSSRDTARLIIAAAADPSAHGRAWHVPSNAPRTQREVAEDLARAAGLAQPKVSTMPRLLLRAVGLVVPDLREVGAMMYQFERPFVLDDSDARAHFGIEPTPWEVLTREVMASVTKVTTAPGTPSRPAGAH